MNGCQSKENEKSRCKIRDFYLAKNMKTQVEGYGFTETLPTGKSRGNKNHQDPMTQEPREWPDIEH